MRETFTYQLESTDIFVDTASQYIDVELILQDLNNTTWYDLPIDKVILHREMIFYLNAEGFRFFLPALFQAVVMLPDESDTLINGIIILLSPPTQQDNDQQVLFIQRVDKFLHAEKRLILQFFDLYFDFYPPEKYAYDSKLVKNIERGFNFWSKQLSDV